MKTIDVYMRQVDIIKEINNNNLKRIHYNDNICKYILYLKVIKDDMVRKSSGRLFQYFGAATVKEASIGPIHR